MLLGGLWHGAAWNFVAWGGLHGLLQIIFRVLKIDSRLKAISALTPAGMLMHFSAWFVTFSGVLFIWVFFRARSFADALTVLNHCFRLDGFSLEPFKTVAFYLAPWFIVEISQYFARQAVPFPFLFRYSARVCLILGLVLLSAEAGKQFIYFDF
jgi:D-alanyl-lipoteichoic acid acyltransferase DltB (MBOAT superfamily)